MTGSTVIGWLTGTVPLVTLTELLTETVSLTVTGTVTETVFKVEVIMLAVIMTGRKEVEVSVKRNQAVIVK